MKRIFSFVAVVVLAWTLPASAVDEHHPDQQKAGPSQTAPKDSTAQPKQPATQSGGMPMGMMGNMEKMQDQMRRLMQTQDPKEREKLLQEHMQTMQQQMKMMGGMMGQGMMGGDKGSASMPSDQCMQMMENRMDMMQKMMEQMLQHQQQMGK